MDRLSCIRLWGSDQQVVMVLHQNVGMHPHRIALTHRGQHRKYLPYVFTEHGAIMAATLLNSPQAVQMSLAVVRAFVNLRRMALSVKALARKVNLLEGKYDKQFKVVFDAVRRLMTPPESSRKRIGFGKPD